MSNQQQEVLRAKVNMETSRIVWKELERFFASGAAVEVSPTLDLVEVAMQMHDDNKTQFEQWLISNLVGKVTDKQATTWLADNTELWAVVVSPWVLVQEIQSNLKS